jgi:hypothetical protein
VIAPPVWFDRPGGRRRTRRCWTCGRDEPILELATDDMRRLGWAPCATQRIPNWCGHSHEYVPWPVGPARWRMVPVWDPGMAPVNPLERHGVADAPG